MTARDRDSRAARAEDSQEEHATPVVIAGGGIAGLEATLALRDLAPENTELTVVAADPDFLYKPLTVEEPFTGEPAEHHELEPMLRAIGARHVAGSIRRVDPDSHFVELGGERTLRYELLVVCVGGRARPAYRGVETFWSSRWDLPVDALIESAAGSPTPVIALVVPPGTSWPLPLYELALMTRKRSEELGHGGLRLELLTPERAPLDVFGPAASEAVSALLGARAIEVRPGSEVTQGASGELRVSPGEGQIQAGAVLALPEIAGPAIDGLPADSEGFIPVDEHGRVEGVSDIYAAGDATNFAIKQGGLATQQADAAAEHVAHQLGADLEPEPFRPVLRGQLITGAESLHLKQDLATAGSEGVASLDYLWWPPQKVSGRYLSAWLGHVTPRRDVEPPFLPLEVAVSWPHKWHGEPMAFDTGRARDSAGTAEHGDETDGAA